MSRIMILGAASDIARATARELAPQSELIVLAARNVSRLESFAKDLAQRGAGEVELLEFDVLDYAAHPALAERFERVDAVVCAVGLLGSQDRAQQDTQALRDVAETNYLAPASVLSVAANVFELRGSGTIVGVSSVAGDRGRASNYAYGSAKAGFTAFLSGLRNRLAASGVHVLTVKPGFVNTSMTEGMDLPGGLTAEPEAVAADIAAAMAKKRNTLYTKWIWRYIMLIIIHIPECIFKKLKL